MDSDFVLQCGDWPSFLEKCFSVSAENFTALSNSVLYSVQYVHTLLFSLGDARWGGYTPGEVLRDGGRVQRDGDGAVGAQPGGPLQLLQQADGAVDHKFTVMIKRINFNEYLLMG